LSSQDYNSYRPKYPKELFDCIYDYHRASPDAKWDLAIDLGCGTGQVTSALSPPFTRVLGVDPSEKMIRVARQTYPEKAPDFIQCISEDLPFLEDGSVDILVAGEYHKWVVARMGSHAGADRSSLSLV
jgi:ubiquinone/menaquinone biosynthesis C-methylase UbiE